MRQTFFVILGFIVISTPLAAQTLQYDGFEYTTNDNVITITNYSGSGGAVVIPSSIDGLPVTGIGKEAFALCTNLTSITISNGVTSIGFEAFWRCTGLTNATIGSGDIGGNAFIGCTNLTSVTIGSGVTGIEDSAFAVTGLTSAIIDASGEIEEAAFDDCHSLTNVTIGSGVTSIHDSAFDDCFSLTTVTIGSGVTSIHDYAFNDCASLTSVYFAGNAPSADATVFNADNPIIYYLPETTGWPQFLSAVNLSGVLWNPQVQTGDGSFGVQNNQFGFNIAGTTNIPIVVEANVDLSQPTWTPLFNGVLTNGEVYFSDPEWTNYPGRFYRIRSP